MIDSRFLGKDDNRDRYLESGFKYRMEFYALTRDIDFQSNDYFNDMCKLYDGISKHCELIEKMGFDSSNYHNELNIVEDYINHLHETYHPEVDLATAKSENQIDDSKIEYPDDFEPPNDDITFIDDLEDVIEL